MLIRNLRRPGDAARAQLAYNDQLRIEIANDNRISKIRENQKKGIIEPPSQEQQLNLSERIGDANQRRQKSFDNLSQVFTPDQVDRIMSLLDDEAYIFLNVYWKDMKNDLTKKVDAKLMDEFYFKGYLNKYMSSIMDQKGLNAPTGTQSSVNELEELESLFEWRDEAIKAEERMKSVDSNESKKLRELISLLPNKRRQERIKSLPDVEKQRVIEGISNSFAGIETDPEEWQKALRERGDVDFYFEVTKLYSNMRNEERAEAQAINDFLDEPFPTVPEEVPLAEEDTSFIGEARRRAGERVPMRNVPVKLLKKQEKASAQLQKQTEEARKQEEARKEAEAEKRERLGEPKALKIGETPEAAEEPKPRSKKGLTQAFPVVEGEAKGKVAEARTMGQSDYMSPRDFDTDEVGAVGKQIRYINLLKQTDILPDQLKTQLFYNKDTGKVNPMSYYREPKQEGVNNRQLFYAKLVTLDRQIKFAFEQRAREEQQAEKKGIGMKRKPGRPKSGKGIASTCKEQTPRWIELGRYRINGRLLDEKQLLSVRYQSGTAVPQFPKMIPISDAFHELLTNLFETKKLDKRLLKELDPEEQRSAEALLVKSGVGRGFGIKEITPTDEEQKKIKRFEIVKGSYLAGNNSKDVIHELRSLIIHFVETGHLSRKDGLRSLMELQ